MKASQIGALIGLSALIGSGWLLTEAYPSEMIFPFTGCIHFAVIGLVGLLGSQRSGGVSLAWTKYGELSAAGLGIFVLPGVVSQLVAGAVSSSASVALFCSIPFVMALGMMWFSETSGRALMMPGLIGLLGALLLFSVEVPGSVRRAVCLAAASGCCIVTAAASVWMSRLMRRMRTAVAVAAVGFAGVAVLGFYGVCVGGTRMTLEALGVETVRCAVFDLPVVWATVWLMREVPPLRLAARFLIAPIVTWVEGYAMVRGQVELRSVAALVLMAAGAGMLLVKDESDEVAGLRLR